MRDVGVLVNSGGFLSLVAAWNAHGLCVAPMVGSLHEE